MKKIIKLFSLLTLFTLFFAAPVQPVLAADEPLDGRWTGSIAVMGTELNIIVNIDSKSTVRPATIDIPQQAAKDLPLKNLKFIPPAITFELESPAGTAYFKGIKDNKKISGDFMQAGIAGKFSLEKETSPKAEVKAEAEKVPYKQEEVGFKNGDINFAGTLTLPETKGPFPAVVMITGSGQQNRDEEIFGFKIFKVIADHLTRRGIAVLRYDDRGIGGSGGNAEKATTADFAADAEAAVKYLQGRKEINSIGLLGHSEGGLIASIIAARNKNIDFMVQLAGTGVNGEAILLIQNELILRANGTSETEIKENIALQKKIFQAMKTDKGWDAVKTELHRMIAESLKKLPEGEQKHIADIKAYTDNMVKSQLTAAQSPWFRYFLTFDPVTALEKVKIPVLALFGELDLQVPAEMNMKAMDKALKKAGNNNVTFKVFPKANHLFQVANNGSPNEYPTLKKEFVPGMLDLIADWILKNQ